MADARQELVELRRMAELEARAGQAVPQQAQQPAAQNIGQNLPLPGVRMGAMDPVYGVGQMVPRALQQITSLGGLAENPVSRLYGKSVETMDKATKRREQAYQTQRQEQGDTGFDWGRLGGNVISPVNYAGAGAAVKAAQAPTMLGKVLGGAVLGGAYGSTAPVTGGDNFAAQKAEQVAWGAGGGAAAPIAGAALGRVFNPQTDDAIKGMLKEGVKLTPGEMAGGTLKRGEDILASVPGVGSLVKGAQRRSIESLNTAAINRSLAPLGKQLPKNIDVGRDAINYAKDTLSQAYDDLLPKLTGKIDQQFADDLRNISDMVDMDYVMNDATKQKFGKILNEQVLNRVSGTGGIQGTAIKEIESFLGDLASKFQKSLDPSEAQLADALREVQDTLRQMVTRSNPQYADQLKAINTGYANFYRIQRAGAAVGAQEGVFTPAQLQNAVKALDRSKDKSQFARGNALMQDLSDPAKAVMAQSIPNSGTVDRGLAAATLFSLGGGASVSPLMAPAAVASLGYVPGGRRIAQALLTERPQAVRELGTAAAKYAPYLSAPLATPLARQQGQ